jgi:anti-sigma regulatory factor (Ser/Thr protein kinase)
VSPDRADAPDPTDESSPWRREFPAEARSLAAVRTSLEDWLATVPDDDAFRAEVVLAASELFTAAVRARTDQDPPARLAVKAERERGAVAVEVEAIDGGRGGHIQHVDASRPLAVAAAVSDTLTVRARRALALGTRKRVEGRGRARGG